MIKFITKLLEIKSSTRDEGGSFITAFPFAEEGKGIRIVVDGVIIEI
jgi:hypothetical protein